MSKRVTIWTRVFGPLLQMFKSSQPMTAAAAQVSCDDEKGVVAVASYDAAPIIDESSERIPEDAPKADLAFELASSTIQFSPSPVPSAAEPCVTSSKTDFPADRDLAMRLALVHGRNIPKARAAKRINKKRSTDVRAAPAKQKVRPLKVRSIASSTWPVYKGRSAALCNRSSANHVQSAQIILLAAKPMPANRRTALSTSNTRKLARAA